MLLDLFFAIIVITIIGGLIAVVVGIHADDAKTQPDWDAHYRAYKAHITRRQTFVDYDKAIRAFEEES
jgi:hypothetical protein